LPAAPIEDILWKHLEGIDTILESEPNFEQTQNIDLEKELETFRPKNLLPEKTPKGTKLNSYNSKASNISKMESK
jgi:hypothetical protein